MRSEGLCAVGDCRRGEPSATVDALLRWSSGVSSSIRSASGEEKGRGGVERMGDDGGATRATTAGSKDEREGGRSEDREGESGG